MTTPHHKEAVRKPSSHNKKVYATWEPGAEERNELIRVAAYYIAERDGFKGNEAKYWAAAKLHIDMMLALRESQEKLQIIIDTALDAFVLMDAGGIVTRWSNPAETIFGWRREEAVGRPLHEMIIPPRYRDAHLQGIKHFLATEEGPFLSSRIEISALHRDGHEFPVELSIVPIKVADTYEFSAFVRDITERKQLEDQVHQLAFYDTLTKLPNRRLLNDRLSQTMAATKRSGCYGALIFIDLDNFKPVNDTHGHEAGDQLLIQMSERLRSCVREMDTVARFGGDEFVVVLSELNADQEVSSVQAEVMAEKIRGKLSEIYRLIIKHEGSFDTTIEHRCTASIGGALFKGHEASPDDILKWADEAMYEAKGTGCNLIRFHDSKARKAAEGLFSSHYLKLLSI